MGKNSNEYGFSSIPMTLTLEDGTEIATNHYKVNSKGERIPVLESDVPQKALEREAEADDTSAPAEQ